MQALIAVFAPNQTIGRLPATFVVHWTPMQTTPVTRKEKKKIWCRVASTTISFGGLALAITYLPVHCHVTVILAPDPIKNV